MRPSAAPPQRTLGPQRRAERSGRLRPFCGIHVLEQLRCHGKIILNRLLIRWKYNSLPTPAKDEGKRERRITEKARETRTCTGRPVCSRCPFSATTSICSHTISPVAATFGPRRCVLVEVLREQSLQQSMTIIALQNRSDPFGFLLGKAVACSRLWVQRCAASLAAVRLCSLEL